MRKYTRWAIFCLDNSTDEGEISVVTLMQPVTLTEFKQQCDIMFPNLVRYRALEDDSELDRDLAAELVEDAHMLGDEDFEVVPCDEVKYLH